MRLSDEQRLAWLRLIRSENIGPVTFRELINHFGSAVGGARCGARASPSAAAAASAICLGGEAERELAAVAAAGARLVALGEPDYPAWLRIDRRRAAAARRARQFRLPWRGRWSPSSARAMPRSPAASSPCSLRSASASTDLVVASGLARGIDAAAHEAALATGTVAVLAGGLDRIYPPENAGLAERILAAGGAQISEMPMGWEPRARDFPRRNRIVSGIVARRGHRRGGAAARAR